MPENDTLFHVTISLQGPDGAARIKLYDVAREKINENPILAPLLTLYDAHITREEPLFHGGVQQ